MAIPYAKVLSHTLHVKYTCAKCGVLNDRILQNPSIEIGYYYSDWSYDYIKMNCLNCNNKEHYEVNL